jgi:CubicO group peptidase (beta-lactamase class C family)
MCTSFPALVIICCLGLPLSGSAAIDPDDAFDPAVATALASSVVSWHDAGLFDGVVLVSHKGKTWTGSAGFAIREWRVPNTPETRFPIASLTKQFTAVLAMRFVERGLLDLDATVSSYLDWYPREVGGRISIRDLLSHTSGLPEMEASLAFENLSATGGTREQILEHFAGEPTFEPGTDFAYTNTDYLVLGAVLTRISDSGFDELIAAEILDPLGMRNTGIAHRDRIEERRARDYVPSGETWLHAPPYRWENWGAAGALSSTVGDLDLWNRALTSHALLTPESTDLMWTPRTDVGSTGNYVALGSWVYPRPLPGGDERPVLVERRGAIGGFAALNVIVKGEDTWIVILANAYNEQIHQLPWGSSLPLDLLLIINGLEPEGPQP